MAEKNIFKVGYGIVDITPDVSVENPILNDYGGKLTRVKEPIYATCIAINDTEKTVLLFTLDIKNLPNDHYQLLCDEVSARTNVPKENLLFHAVHDHNSMMPGIPASSAKNLEWTEDFKEKVAEAGELAIADLSEASMLSGMGKTTNIAFVRRYIHEDGSFSGLGIRYDNISKTPVVRHESEADDTVQIVRFVRKGKKDILIANWQAHAAHGEGTYPDAILGDITYHFRKNLQEKEDNLLVALFYGASGNINLTVRIPSRNVCNANYEVAGSLLADIVYGQLGNLKEMETGKINIIFEEYDVPFRPVSDERLGEANAVNDAGAPGSPEYKEMLVKYDFNSAGEVNVVLYMDEVRGQVEKMPLHTVSVGNLAFASVPYEMFDTNGVEIKTASPYSTTFILSNTNGTNGYVPSALAVPNGGYEVYSSYFKYGTGENVAGELINMLYKMHNSES